ncbi:hypothetical protein RvY_13188 [Ramazzottius varieornatus]|uniref:TNFR-Cys domain-containing protein n=1 Tax=Ramazzottius varieornatus TaxID=947166 RepID=A0A1D1VM10_RAMVA|nr:hypothetical protein RvY_13188 [Ramazzottius varieornatus]
MDRLMLAVCVFVMILGFASGMENSSDDLVLLHPCLEHEYWNNGTCKQCSTCMTDQQVIETCSTTKDTVCRCKSEGYLDSVNHICRSCRECPTGSLISVGCTEFSDTQCSPCPEGTFHNLEKNVCQDCQACLDGEAEAEACGPTSDRVCVNGSIALSISSYYFMGSSYKINGVTSGRPERQQSSSHFKRDSPEQGRSIIVRPKIKSTSVDPIFCLPPAFIIIVLVCYAGLRFYENSVDRKISLCPWFLTEPASILPRTDLETGLLQPNMTQVPSIAQPRIYRPLGPSLTPLHVPYGRSVSTVNEVVLERGRTGTNSTNRTSLMNSFGMASNDREMPSGPMMDDLAAFIPAGMLNPKL